MARINDAKSTDPGTKFRYGFESIRRQLFWFDVEIVIRQVRKVREDVWETVR